MSTPPSRLILKPLYFFFYTWSGLQKAKNAPVFTYTKGNFQNPMDLYVTDFSKSTERITSINPQQKDYNWGTVELYHWLAYDGTPLENEGVTVEKGSVCRDDRLEARAEGSVADRLVSLMNDPDIPARVQLDAVKFWLERRAGWTLAATPCEACCRG